MKRWKTQFQQGFAQFNNVDSKTHKNYKDEITISKMESTVDIYKKETQLTKQHVDKRPHEEKKRWNEFEI